MTPQRQLQFDHMKWYSKDSKLRDLYESTVFIVIKLEKFFFMLPYFSMYKHFSKLFMDLFFLKDFCFSSRIYVFHLRHTYCLSTFSILTGTTTIKSFSLKLERSFQCINGFINDLDCINDTFSFQAGYYLLYPTTKLFTTNTIF